MGNRSMCFFGFANNSLLLGKFVQNRIYFPGQNTPWEVDKKEEAGCLVPADLLNVPPDPPK